jgi:hypothetical protein
MPLDRTSRGDVHRSSQKVKDEVSLSGQWTSCRDSQVVMEPKPLICRSATVHKQTIVLYYSRAHGSGGRRRRALCINQTRHASRSGDMQAHASRRIKRLCSQPASPPATFVGQVRCSSKNRTAFKTLLHLQFLIHKPPRRSPHTSRFLHITHPATPPHSSTTSPILNPLPPWRTTLILNLSNIASRDISLLFVPPLVHRFFSPSLNAVRISSHCIASHRSSTTSIGHRITHRPPCLYNCYPRQRRLSPRDQLRTSFSTPRSSPG